MARTAVNDRFFLLFLPALIALVVPLLACGGSGRALPECQSVTNGEACSQCCVEQLGTAYSGHSFNSLSSTPCSCN